MQAKTSTNRRPYRRMIAPAAVLVTALALVPVFSSGASAAVGLTDLSLTKTDSADPVTKGGAFSYTITVKNQGPNDASAVTVTDPLPSRVSFVSASSSAGSCTQAGSVVTCNLGTLNAGLTATVTISVKASKSGTASNTATVTSPEDSTPANNSDTEATVINNPSGKGKKAVGCATTPTIVGTIGNDSLVGTSKADVILGLGGDDSIDSGGGNDIVCAGSGNDVVTGGPGADFVSGGIGADRLFGSFGGDLLKGKAGRDRIFGNGGNDRLNGGRGHDRCRGGAGHDSLKNCP